LIFYTFVLLAQNEKDMMMMILILMLALSELNSYNE
jgi:hypothetical protein